MNDGLFGGAGAYLLLSAIALMLVALCAYFFISLRKRETEISKEREESTRRLYELAILKELGERVGYSLNVEEILQIITGSLRQFIDYTAVGYVVITPDKVKLNTNFERSVGSSFLQEMKERMVASLSALTNKTFDPSMIEEVVSGAIVTDEARDHIGSFFNIPLVIGGEVAGVLTVAHLKPGLYKEADMTILYKITGQASQAVTRLQEVVKMEKGKLNAMVQSMGDGVLMVDTEYRVMVANPAVKKIINFIPPVNPDGTPGDHHVNIFHFVDALGGKFDIHGRLEEALVHKNSFVSERINIGDSFFEIGVYPVLHKMAGKGEHMLGAVVVFHDISKDIELEKVREEFTGMIVHELRSPLDGIKKIIELIISGAVVADQDKTKEYLNMAYQSSSSMLELVNDLLDLSKLQAGKFEVNKEKASPKETIENRIAFYKISAESRQLTLRGSFASNLPEICDFDPQAVKQILNNFISNSMKFTSPGGNILVSAFSLNPGEEPPEDLDRSAFQAFPSASDIQAKSPSLCVVVSDTGIGIPQKDMEGLFHTFTQARLNPVDKESKSTGLGLVIAKGIAEAHGGSIGVVSKEGAGTSFFFTIPF